MTRKHPHFDDGGTLDWHTHYADALAEASKDGKIVFIEMGRELCSQCRTLVQSIVPMEGVARVLKEHYVALASDADAPEHPVIDLAMENMQDAMMLPFVLFVDGDGKFLGGSHGAVAPDTFLEKIESLVAT